MLPYYEGKYETIQDNIDFESAKEILMKKHYKRFVQRRFERIYNAIETITYTKYEELSENKKIFVYAFKHVKTEKN